MSNHVLPFKGPGARPQAVPRMLYIGPSADEICDILSHHIGRVETAYEQDVQAAFAQLRRQRFDVVVVDQRDENLATRLIIPVLQSLGYPVKPVVISPLRDLSHYLAIPGVARVLAAPVKEDQLLRVLGLERRKPSADAPKAEGQGAPSGPKVKPKSLVQRLSDRFMNLVSTLYKRAAFVLLFSLFVAFAFYGVLIAFFLLSSGWGAPLTLARGHELVNKVEREMTEVMVALNQTEQRLSEQLLARSTAQRELENAEALAKYAAGTVRKELEGRERQNRSLEQAVKRLVKVRKQLAAQVDGAGPSANLEKLYKKRLIDRTTFSAGTLSLIEASQKLAAIEIEIDEAQNRITEFASSKDMLKSLELALREGRDLQGISASSSDLLLLTKQASESLAAQVIAKSQLENVDRNVDSLNKSKTVLEQQLVTLNGSALARALEKRIDVVFVPYGNERQFTEGRTLYSCTFTILWCRAAGKVGKPLPGEINSVHPFFGKPIRGSFVEMNLHTPDAAMREIIHGTRKPLFL